MRCTWFIRSASASPFRVPLSGFSLFTATDEEASYLKISAGAPLLEIVPRCSRCEWASCRVARQPLQHKSRRVECAAEIS